MSHDTQVKQEAPERIWISSDRGLKWTDYAFDGGIEYVRVSAPIVAPEVDDNDINAGVWFQSALSGGWYRTRESAGDLSAIRVDGVPFVPSPNALCVCGHIRKVHESFEDHDECMGCIKERNGLTEDHCSWFQAAPASTVAPQQSKHHKHCSSWTVNTSGERQPCDCVCECTHSMFQHIRPGEHYWYEDCAVDGCPCMKFTAPASPATLGDEAERPALAKAAGDEVWLLVRKYHDEFNVIPSASDIAAIIERCLAGGGESGQSDAS